MESSEIEFIAEKEIIQVIPNFTQDTMYLISGNVGPFSAGLPVSVPLWLAVNLKQRQKCRIIPPEWLNVDVLKVKKQEEADSRYFTSMPSQFYMEVTQLLLHCATDDVAQADEVRTLIKDIWDLRIAKLRSSIDVFIKSGASHAKLNHLTLMEINSVRLFLTSALDHVHRLKAGVDGDPSVLQQPHFF